MSDKYILDGHTPVPVDDLIEWGRWMQDADDARRVAKTELKGSKVSTVFLGLDHRFLSDGPPILFETMIFGGVHDDYQERYATWEEAEAGHQRAVARVQESLA